MEEPGSPVHDCRAPFEPRVNLLPSSLQRSLDSNLLRGEGVGQKELSFHDTRSRHAPRRRIPTRIPQPVARLPRYQIVRVSHFEMQRPSQSRSLLGKARAYFYIYISKGGTWLPLTPVRTPDDTLFAQPDRNTIRSWIGRIGSKSRNDVSSTSFAAADSLPTVSLKRKSRKLGRETSVLSR